MDESLAKLPKGWVRVRLDEISYPSKEKADPLSIQEIPYVGLEHIARDSGKLLSHGYSSQVRSIKTKFYQGDVLYGKLRPYLNKVYIADFNGVCSTDIFVFSKNPHISNKYLAFALLSNDFVRYATQNMSGVQHPRVDFIKLSQFPIHLPPLPEQHRIVAKIEELFTRLDAGVEALKKVKAQLKRYRQAVLKYAFEGKLTQEWREANKDKLEPASILLERIKEERRKKLGGKFKELPPVDTTDLPDLPEDWIWTRIGEVIQKIQYGTSEQAGDDSTGIPVIRMGNIFEGKIVFDNLKYFRKGWPQLNDFLLKDGDVLFNRTNSMELVGKTAVYKRNYPEAIFASYLIRVEVNKDSYNPDLLSFFINSFYGRKYITSVVSQQVGQANVNGSKLSFMPIPLPSPVEQKKIVEEIEARLSMAECMEKNAEQTLKQSDKLRQSILKSAFEGNLVPQDPTDEPAEKLLERIRSESAKRLNSCKIKHDRKRRALNDNCQIEE